MFEQGSVLRAWALQSEPEGEDSKDVIEAVALPDHRPAYLDYEGPVSQGRGCVEQWDGGTFLEIEMSDERVEAELNGRKLVGRATLVRVTEGIARWRFAFLAKSHG